MVGTIAAIIIGSVATAVIPLFFDRDTTNVIQIPREIVIESDQQGD